MPYMDEDVRARLAELVEEIETSTFRETKWGRRGYAERDVDDFLDYMVDVLFHLLSAAERAAAPVPPAHTVEAEAEVAEPDETQLVAPEEAAVSEGDHTEILDPSLEEDAAVPAAEADPPAPEEEAEQPPPPPWVRPGPGGSGG